MRNKLIAIILEKAVVHESHEKHEPIQSDVTNRIITSMVSSMTQRNLDLFRDFRVFRGLIAVFRAIVFISALNCQVYAAEVGQPAPQFSLPSLAQDQAVSLSQFKGKVVYVDFWASWCAPCRVSFPLLNKLHQKLKAQGFEVVAINLDEDKANAEKFLKSFPVGFTVLRDGKGEWADQYVVESMPTSFILDRQGVIRLIHHGFTSDDVNALEQKIVQLLEAKS